MSEKPNNPPAFPFERGEHYQYGMTLRDYFAAAACNGCIANELFRREASHNPQVIAEFSYEVADAMLKARGE